MAGAMKHPFTPSTVVIPDFEPNTIGREVLLVCYGLVVLVTISFVLFTFKKDHYGVRLSTGNRLLMCWFAMCGVTHVILEGSYTITRESIAWRSDILSQIWKEYSKADSRYILAHPAVVSIEFLTAWLEGPSCFVILWMTYKKSGSRYVLELLVSTGQLYGTIVFFMDAILTGFENTPFGDPVYFWIYFIGFNFPWLVIPTYVICRDYFALTAAQVCFDRTRDHKRN